MRCGCDRQSSHTRRSSAAVALRCIRAVKQISALLSPLGRRRRPACRPLKTHARIRLLDAVCVYVCCGALLAPESIVVAPPQPQRGAAARMHPPSAWRMEARSATCTFAVLSRHSLSPASLQTHSGNSFRIHRRVRQFPPIPGSEWERGKERKKDRVSVFALFAGS